MKTLIYTLSVALIILCVACQNELTPDFDDMNGVLTINAFLYTGQDTNFVFVSETTEDNPISIDNATVEMSINGNKVETVDKVYSTGTRIRKINTYESVFYDTIEPISYNGVYMLTHRFEEGDVVRIDVYSNGRHAWAEETAPRKVENPKADFTFSNRTVSVSARNRYYNLVHDSYDTYTDWRCADFKITVPDISAQADYYRLSINADYSERVTEWKRQNCCYYEWENIDSVREALSADADTVVPVSFTDMAGDTEIQFYYLQKTLLSHSQTSRQLDFSYNGDPILSEGEMKTSTSDDSDLESDFLNTVKNKYKVFSDHRFSSGSADLRISLPMPFTGNLAVPEDLFIESDYFKLPEEYLIKSGTTYNMKVRLLLQSISENQFYYLKALNAIESEDYEDMAQLSGSLKIPSNVSGGCGNICITTNTVLEFTLLENFARPRKIVEAKYYGNNDWGGYDWEEY